MKNSFDTITENKIKAYLFKARNDIIYQFSNFDKNNKNIRFTLMNNTETILLSIKGVTALNTIVRILLENNNIKKNFSNKTIRRVVESILVKFYKTFDEGNEKMAKVFVEELIKYFKDDSYRDWNILILLSNLDIEVEKLIIGNVMFEKCSEEYFDNFKRHIETNLEYALEIKQFSLSITKFFIGKLIAKCTVSAIDKGRALEVANKEIDSAINVLRFYGRAVKKQDTLSNRMFFDKKGFLCHDQTYEFYSNINSDNKENPIYSMECRKTGYLLPFILDKEEVDHMNKMKLDIINKILKKKDEDKTEFENRLIKAIILFGEAMNETNIINSFIKFVFSLEVLLINPGESKGVLVERVPLLLADDVNERLEISKEVDRLYELRSGYVHAGEEDITESDVKSISYIGFFSIFEMLSFEINYNTFGELTNKFDQNKFSGPRFMTI